MKKLTVILGNQLFPHSYYQALPSEQYFMAEDYELCTHFKYHKHKILFFLLSMRSYRDELLKKNFSVFYHELPLSLNAKTQSYLEKLEHYCKSNQISEIHLFEIEDKFMEERLLEFCGKQGISLVVYDSPMFMVTRESFRDYLKKTKRPFMKTFYEAKRKEFNILLDPEGRPFGGQWSFDEDNRQKLPKNHTPPVAPPKLKKKSPHFEQVNQLVEYHFNDHPGSAKHFWLPTTLEESHEWLENFLHERFEFFGHYEDALSTKHDFLYHSVLSPMMNLGHLTPGLIIQRALEIGASKKIPLNSLEGFIRQIMGWREFIRGIYQEFDEIQQVENFFQHERKLNHLWYTGETGIPPLDFAIQKTVRFGYAHHIERLMVIGNIMLLCEVHPQEVYRWFMEMFVDSSDWVMGPNVFGMGQFSDGGIFATKPYICGSNYLLKMSDFPKGDWCPIMDGLYWRFVDKHRDFFLTQPRLSMMVRTLEKMDQKRKEFLFAEAETFIKKVTS